MTDLGALLHTFWHDGRWIDALSWLCIAYFAVLNGACIALNLLALRAIGGDRAQQRLPALPGTGAGLEPGIALVMPAHDEAATIAAAVRAMLLLDYPDFELIVVNDSSKDDTLGVLQREFKLHRFPEAYRVSLAVQPVRALYRSPSHPRLRVIDKAGGGRADAVNAGINAAHHGLVCIVDAGSVLQHDSLRRIVQPFMQDARVIAAGGAVRVANGCRLRQGTLTQLDVPGHWLACIQVVEYLRCLLFSRLGWARLNALPFVPGALGLFKRATLVEAGGLAAGTTGDDLALRLHQLQRLAQRDYRIAFVPDAVAWTEAPESMALLRGQRIRWQIGLMQSLAAHGRLLGHPRAGAVGWLAYPFLLVFEGLGPLIELLAYAVMTTLALFGQITWPALGAFVLMAVGLGTLVSASALLLEEIAFGTYRRPRQMVRLLAAVVMENLGYRQLNAWWRLLGLWRWASGNGATGAGGKGLGKVAGSAYNAGSHHPPRSTT
jgi:cellulose synthase/poly-beta-1,6-N-acetylglucosamine synthase-like glycosyltransferase